MNSLTKNHTKFFRIAYGSTLTIFCLLMIAQNTFADGNDAAAKNALAKAQYMLRQASTEKADLEKQLAQQKSQIEALTKENLQVKMDLKNRLNAVNPQDEVLRTLKEGGQKMQSRIESEQEKNVILTEKNHNLNEQLLVKTKNFEQCYDNNKKLYEVNKEILGRYQDKGLWAAIKQKEPVTAIERVKVENLVQDYQYQIESLQVKLVSEQETVH